MLEKTTFSNVYKTYIQPHIPVKGKDEDDQAVKVAGIAAGVAAAFFAAIVFGIKPVLLITVLAAGGYALYKFINKEGFDFSKIWSWNATEVKTTEEVKK